jgi:CRP-like cAMP-binding protein
MLTSSGKVVTFQKLGRGEMFGELAAIDGKPWSTSVITVEETRVIRISGLNFKDMVARIPSLAELTMLRLCELSRFLCERAFISQGYSIPQQIRLEIYRVISTQPIAQGAVTIEPTSAHEEIVQHRGTTCEQVTRVMSDLSKHGLIAQSRKS